MKVCYQHNSNILVLNLEYKNFHFWQMRVRIRKYLYMNRRGLNKEVILSLQGGMYYEPPHLSADSKDLIRRMLDVNVQDRIVMQHLLDHPWVCHGYDKPVTCEPDNYKKKEDQECVEIMAKHSGTTILTMASRVGKWLYDYTTATYLLLLGRKKRQEPLLMRDVSSSELQSQV